MKERKYNIYITLEIKEICTTEKEKEKLEKI